MSVKTTDVGVRRIVWFMSANLTLAYNATSLILPGNANITTVAGDVGTFISLGSGNWVCVDCLRDDGKAIVSTTVDFARGFLSGLEMSNGTDSDHDIDFTAGECRGADDDEDITLAAFTKQIDATWAAGSAAGGLSSSLKRQSTPLGITSTPLWLAVLQTSGSIPASLPPILLPTTVLRLTGVLDQF